MLETPPPLPDSVADEALEQEESESLSDALNRFWEQNVEHQFPDRENSILSETMVGLLIRGRPETEHQWFNAIPMAIRQEMDPRQRGFLGDILDVIAEYA